MFRRFRRWPNGLRYAPGGWWSVWCGERKTYVPQGNGWQPKPAKVREDGSEAGPDFLKAKGPLRYDDWLEAALGLESAAPPSGRKEWRKVEPAPAVSAFVARRSILDEAAWDEGEGSAGPSSALGGELPFRVRATALVLKGKIAVATAERALPLFALDVEGSERLPVAVASVVEAIAACADQLKERTRQAVKLDRAEGKVRKVRKVRLADDLRDALMQAMDAAVAAFPERFVGAWRGTKDPDARSGIAVRLEGDLVEEACRRALELFDEAFPLVTLDAMTARVARERRSLSRALKEIARKHGPALRNGGKDAA